MLGRMEKDQSNRNLGKTLSGKRKKKRPPRGGARPRDPGPAPQPGGTISLVAAGSND